MNKYILAIFFLTLSCATSTHIGIQMVDFKKQAYFSTGMLNVDAKLKTGKIRWFHWNCFCYR